MNARKNFWMVSRRSRRSTQKYIRSEVFLEIKAPSLQQNLPSRLQRNLRDLRETLREVNGTLKFKWLVAFILLTACVDRINFNVPPAKFQTVVEGMISDSPGPYTVNVSKSLSLDASSPIPSPVENAKIKLYDDEGNSEDLAETTPGVYMTGGIIQGKVGHAYHIRVETPDGTVFESEPDKINPVGEVDTIRYEFEARTIQKSYGEVEADVFNIFVDADAGAGDANYVRWRFTGTYKVLTHPEFHSIFLQVSSYIDPLPCSGYVVEPALGGGKLVKVAECTCCTCWVNQYESAPQVSDGQFVSGNQYRNVKVGEVPINSATFSDKYRVEVEQMSLSKNSFEFFRLIRAQKAGASSLFQPPFGEIKGNVSPVNSTAPVVGLFWATSVTTKYLFITPGEVPYLLTPMDIITDACTVFSNSSTTQPAFWQ